MGHITAYPIDIFATVRDILNCCTPEQLRGARRLILAIQQGADSVEQLPDSNVLIMLADRIDDQFLMIGFGVLHDVHDADSLNTALFSIAGFPGAELTLIYPDDDTFNNIAIYAARPIGRDQPIEEPETD